MLNIGDKIASNVTGRTYTVTWASEKITQAEVGFASTPSDGEAFFIKRLLCMKYPAESSPGSPAMKAKRREECDNLYDKYFRLYKSIEEGCGKAGACVPIEDYFRDGVFYYTVYRKINADSLTLKEIASMSEQDKFKLLLRLVQGLQPLHTQGVIHGDLKPENILVQRDGETWRIRLIDMNDCYAACHPNPPGEVIGTPDYYSPELITYNTYEIEDEEDDIELRHITSMANSLTTKSDVFALGIIFCEFYTGERPIISDDTIKFINEAAVNGALHLPLSLPKKFSELLKKMLEPDHKCRLTITQVGEYLKNMIKDHSEVRIIATPNISASYIDENTVKITITTDSDMADIYYSIDGTTPTKDSIKYSSPFNIPKFTPIKAIVITHKGKTSLVQQMTAWVKSGGMKVVSKPPRIKVNGMQVEISTDCVTETKIYYTIDGSKPTISSTEYDAPFKVTVIGAVSKIRAVAKELGENKLLSSVVEANVYKGKVNKPTIRYKSGTVTMESDGTPIYYTTNGTKPNNLSFQFNESFVIPDTTKFHIIAVCIDNDGAESEIVEIKRPKLIMS